MQVFDIATGKKVNSWQSHSYHISAVALSPDGKRVACGTDDSGVVRIWDVITAKELFPAEGGHTATVGEVAVLKDGTVISQDYQRTFGRWDPSTGKSTHFWEWPAPLYSPMSGFFARKQAAR